MEDDVDLGRLSDDHLLISLKACVADERRCLVKVLRRLAEVDRRRLHEKKMRYASLFAFACKELGYSEDAAYRRIVVARAAAHYPILYRRIAGGRLSFTAAARIAKHLTPDNHRELIERCCGMSRADVDRLVAGLEPALGEPRDRVRFLAPARRDASKPAGGPPLPFAGNAPAPGRKPPASASPTPPQPPAEDAAGPLFAEKPEPPAADAPEPAAHEPVRVEIRFPADQALYRRLERARALLRHKYPAGRYAEVIADALEALLERIDPERRLARRDRRRRRLRHCGAEGDAGSATPAAPKARRLRIPLQVRDEVWRRDGGRCAFVGEDERRCEETGFLEVDHVVPLARGGSSDDARNLRLLCRRHNLLEARRMLGEHLMARFERGK